MRRKGWTLIFKISRLLLYHQRYVWTQNTRVGFITREVICVSKRYPFVGSDFQLSGFRSLPRYKNIWAFFAFLYPFPSQWVTWSIASRRKITNSSMIILYLRSQLEFFVNITLIENSHNQISCYIFLPEYFVLFDQRLYSLVDGLTSLRMHCCPV